MNRNGMGNSAARRAAVHYAVSAAEESPLPDPSTLLDGVFATAEELDTPHHK